MPSKTNKQANPFNCIPPFLNEVKKLGPTCKPIEKIKRIKPNSLIKCIIVWSTVKPK